MSEPTEGYRVETSELYPGRVEVTVSERRDGRWRPFYWDEADMRDATYEEKVSIVATHIEKAIKRRERELALAADAVALYNSLPDEDEPEGLVSLLYGGRDGGGNG